MSYVWFQPRQEFIKGSGFPVTAARHGLILADKSVPHLPPQRRTTQHLQTNAGRDHLPGIVRGLWVLVRAIRVIQVLVFPDLLC